MTITYLIDTDWVIHYLNGHSAIAGRLEELQEAGFALSVISLAELYEGFIIPEIQTGTSRLYIISCAASR